MTVLATLGNMSCFINHCMVKKNLCVFLVHLQCANLCMGIYTGAVAVANERLRGQFVHHEDTWRDSASCKLDGFMCTLSSEVSVLVVFLLMLDHLIVLRFPHSLPRFGTRSAAVACGVTSVVGILLAAIPLLPGLSHLGHYGQTAVCSLALDNMHQLQSKFGLYHSCLVLNCLLSVAVVCGEITVYRAMPRYLILVDPSRRELYASADLKMKIAVTDAAGWFIVTTVAALASGGVSGWETVKVLTAVAVLPLNSAVNPLLCLGQVMTRQRRVEREERLLRVLKSKMKDTSKRVFNT